MAYTKIPKRDMFAHSWSVRARRTRARRVWRVCVSTTLVMATLALVAYEWYNNIGSIHGDASDSNTVSLAHSRMLKSSGGGCALTHSSWMRKGGWTVYVVGILYMFLGIAIVCDDYFVASLEKICDKLNLSEDVAGATFMAAGSSAPELFSSGMSLISPDATNEIGISAIVGSAVFNILFIIGATVLCAGQTLQLDWRPVTRDCGFYALAILTILLIFYDGVVRWYEGLISVLLYFSYVLFMCYNAKILNWMGDPPLPPSNELDKTIEVIEAPCVDVVPTLRRADTRRQSRRPVREEVEEKDGFDWPESSTAVPLHVLSLPWRYAFYYTIPDCSKPPGEKWFKFAFLTSIAWISAISYCMVSWAARVGCIIGIPEVVMGTLVVAAGTSIPDALGSIAVAKAGEGNMAVANAVGSNVFDIWLGLGLPWLIILPTKTGGRITLETKQLLPSVGILFGVLVIYYLSLYFNSWRLTRRTGAVFLLLYLLFAAYCIFFVWLQDIYNLS
jgi:K+-dependent Na+/Ca+ exchanger-like protein